MKQRKKKLPRSAPYFKSKITHAKVLKQLQTVGEFTYKFQDGNLLWIGKSNGTFRLSNDPAPVELTPIEFLQVHYGVNEQYGSGIGTIFMVSHAQYFPRQYEAAAIACFFDRLHGNPSMYSGYQWSLQDIYDVSPLIIS